MFASPRRAARSRRRGRPRVPAFSLACLAALTLALSAATPALASPQASGRALEEAMAEVLLQNGFALHDKGMGDVGAAARVAWRHVGYTTIYGGRGYVDFVLTAPELDRPVWVEAMRQRTRGSMDERLPYLLLNAAIAFPDARVVLVLDGTGWRAGARAWARARARAIGSKPVTVMSLPLFRDWLRRRLSGGGRLRSPRLSAPGSGYLADTVRE